MKRMESANKTSKSKGTSTKRIQRRATTPRFVVCIKSGGYVDLVPLKVYRTRRDSEATALGQLRVVDESGEDYLYPAEYFRPIQAPNRLFEIVERS